MSEITVFNTEERSNGDGTELSGRVARSAT